MNQDIFATTLTSCREQRGLTMAELGELTGLSRTTIWRLEQSPAQRPSPANVERLADALQVPCDELLAAAGYPARPLPRLQPYLRATLGMSPQQAAEAAAYIERTYGSATAPQDGEDELDY